MNKPHRLHSVKNTMIGYSLSIIFLMTILSMFSINMTISYKSQMEQLFEKHIYLSEIEETMDLIDDSLLGFLSSKSSTMLNEYLKHKEALKHLNQPPDEIITTDDLLFDNISHLLESYETEAEKAIEYKRERNVYAYDRHYTNSVAIKGYVQDYIDQMNKEQLSVNSKTYLEIVRGTQVLQRVTFVVISMLIALSLIIVYLIGNRMTKPFASLSYAAEEIGKGNFNTEDVIITTNDEFRLLASAFNKMKNSISDYVEVIKTKAETENKLKDQQLLNVKMAHLLDNAKLKNLQSQINPHFLFNTINAGVQLSIMERADRTGRFLESMAKLFRYSLQKNDGDCTLGDEIENIRDYYHLLKERFQDKIKFDFRVDPSALNLSVPPMILQPLVENAYIHGLSGLEKGGEITLSTVKHTRSVFITIKDTGVGMSDEVIEQLMTAGKESDFGIGVRNVRDRLDLFYHHKAVMTIESESGIGTKIIIEIPTFKE